MPTKKHDLRYLKTTVWLLARAVPGREEALFPDGFPYLNMPKRILGLTRLGVLLQNDVNVLHVAR